MAANTERETFRRSQIIEAALREISAKGSYNVTLESIANAAGLSKGGVTHYFASKDQLYEAAFKEFFDIIFIRSKKTMDKCSDPLDKILSFDWLYDWNDATVNIGYSLLHDCMAMASHDDKYRRLFHKWVDNWITLLKDAVREGVKSGIFRTLDADAMARTISAVYQGIAARWYLDRENHPTTWAVNSFQDAIRRLLINAENKADKK